MIFNKSGDVIDYENYRKKRATISDILKAITIGDNLEFTERITHFVEPKKYKKYIDIICYYLLFLYSKKKYFLGHIGSVNSSKCIIEMAKVVAENDTQLSNGSILEYELLPINNLEYSKEQLEIAHEFAKNNLKIMAGHWCWMGYHTPFTYASALTLSNANILAGITLVMMLNPKQLFVDYVMDIFTVNKHYMDSPIFGSPNQVIFAIAAKQIADYYGFNVCLANTGLTDSIENNFQSGFERGVTAALTIASGAELIGLEGLAGANSGVSFEQLIVDNELLSYLNFIFNKKIIVDDKTLNFKKIKIKGIGNNFAEDLKIEKNLKEAYWESCVFSYEKFDDLKINESYKKIKYRIKEILKNNYPPKPVIDEYKIHELNQIIGKYIEDKNFINTFKKDLNKAVACLQD